ncbi:uncharacterized protein LOC113275509 isoform X2 [Papaver somniferum]|uniref:uncharacterized protein LOC113275509 isoform X2 n=1 Tax=Papaver somniferum TaxID=3469 RepID=UPI000E6FBBED|nr:uncharacterized protein LOC113275509 isoform X2 [Papaver somniferum]XP_026380825.1 uncharacterized protein LOC113275509 isoform X2 [Papaver somniferum]
MTLDDNIDGDYQLRNGYGPQRQKKFSLRRSAVVVVGKKLVDAVDEDSLLLPLSRIPNTNPQVLPVTNPQAVSVLTRRQVLCAQLTGGWDGVKGGWATARNWIRPRLVKAWTALKEFVREVVWHTSVVTCSKYLVKLCSSLRNDQAFFLVLKRHILIVQNMVLNVYPSVF